MELQAVRKTAVSLTGFFEQAIASTAAAGGPCQLAAVDPTSCSLSRKKAEEA